MKVASVWGNLFFVLNAYHSLGTDYTDFTDKLVFTFTKNRVNPCNPCQKKEVDMYFDFTFASSDFQLKKYYLMQLKK